MSGTATSVREFDLSRLEPDQQFLLRNQERTWFILGIVDPSSGDGYIQLGAPLKLKMAIQFWASVPYMMDIPGFQVASDDLDQNLMVFQGEWLVYREGTAWKTFGQIDQIFVQAI